jgi:peptide/nickel transport system ATP-binding protein
MTITAPTPALRISDLRIETLGGRSIVDGVDLHVAPGEVLAIVGESGSGKTTTGLAMLGHARAGLRIASARFEVGGSEPLSTSDVDAIARLRGRRIAYVPQDPATALNPSMRVGAQIRAVLLTHEPSADVAARTAEVLDQVQLPSDESFLRRFPHQLSGGQQQRVAIAIGLVCRPIVAVFDEPTTGLDVVTQSRLLEQLEHIRRATGLALVYVTHDLGVVAQIAHRIAVMLDGSIVEEGAARDVLTRPQHEYTKRLLAATPDHAKIGAEARADATEPARAATPRLRLQHVQASYAARRSEVVVASDITFDIGAGECVALVGQSGSGKSTLSRVVAGLHAPSRGEILLDGVALAATSAKRTRAQREAIQMIFQNPRESLNPRRTVLDSVARAASVLRRVPSREADRIALELLDRVRLEASMAGRYPDELSGGQLQRVALARALAAEASVLVCDEVTSALDVSVQATVLDLLAELRQELGLSMLFVTHDLGVVARIAQRVVVLDRGVIVESGTTEDVLSRPDAPYTRMLLDAAPSISVALGAASVA